MWVGNWDVVKSPILEKGEKGQSLIGAKSILLLVLATVSAFDERVYHWNTRK